MENLVGGNSNIFDVHPFFEEDEPILTHIISKGLKPQPTRIDVFCWFLWPPIFRYCGIPKIANLGGGFKHFLFSPLPGKMIPFY